ncbi:MAG TPA: flagellar filament capping protein FliD [Gryllotalpicola sp.]
MAGIQLSGLASGLDTASLIQSLMAAASQPQSLLDQQITTQKNTVGDLQSLNALFASLASDTGKFTATAGLGAYTATISDPSVATATADTTAAAGDLSFTVDRLASRQVEVTGPLNAWPSSPPALTIVAADGTHTSVTPNSTSLDSVVSAINASGAGVTAVKVKAGTDSDGNALYRLQLSSSQTGANGAFTVYAGTPDEVAAGTATDLAAQPGAATISTAQDAQLTLWPGTAAAQTVTSSTNEFADVLPGADVTASAVSATPVTLSVNQDLKTESGTASSLVATVSNILQTIAKGSATTTTTDDSGNTDTVFGSFTADSTVRGAGQQLSDALTLDVDGVSPSSIGIDLAKDGTISFDQDAFQAAMTADPQKTTQIFDAIVARVNTATKQVSDPFTGTLTDEINSDNDSIDSMQQKSDDMQTLLDQQQTTLQQQFAYMETMMSQFQSQGSYLQQYVDALSSSSSSSKS